jgi:protein TonB
MDISTLDRASFARIAPLGASLALHVALIGLAAVVVPASARVLDVIHVDLVAIEPPRLIEAAPAPPKRVAPPKPITAPIPKTEERPAREPEPAPTPAPAAPAAPVAVTLPSVSTSIASAAAPSPGVSLVESPSTRPSSTPTVASVPRDTGITRVAQPTGGYQVRPGYPSSARRLGIQGTTMLRVHVLDDGRVGEIIVDQSAGHADMEQTAADAVRRWRFEPARRGEEKVAMWVRIPVEFKLR